MRRLLNPAVVLLVVAALAAGAFGWSRLQALREEVAGLRGTAARLEGDLGELEGRWQAAETRADAAESRANDSEELNRRLAQRIARAEGDAAAAADRADAERARAEGAVAEAERAAAARASAEEARRDAVLLAESAFLEAERAKTRARELAERRARELDRLETVLGRIAETRRTALGVVMNLGTGIEFDFDRAELRPENRELLARIAGVLMTADEFAIQVFGHTDDVGSADYNQRLSERRAESVRRYLVEAGVAPEAIQAVGMGKSSPLAAGSDEASRQRNRRVEIAVIETSGEAPADLLVDDAP